MPKNFFHSFSVTSAAIPGTVSALASGVGGGLSQSVSAAQKASAVLSENSGQRDSLLRSLNILFEDPTKLDHSMLETYLDELNEGLVATNDSFALVVRNILLGLYSGVGHISQIPIDLSQVAVQTGIGLAHSEVPSDKMQEASNKASTFNMDVDGSSASVRSVTNAVSKQGGDVMEKIHKDIEIAGNSHAATHANAAASTSAAGSMATTAIIPTAVALATDTVGHVFRESGALNYHCDQESASADKLNVYHASSGVAKATQDSDSQASKQQSHDLEAALSNIRPAAKLASDRGVATPLTIVLLRLIVLSLFVESSRGINKTALAVAEGRIQKALAKATEQGPSAGVDRINSLHSNLSSLSNIMRLCAENLGGSPAVKIAAQSSEVILSRAMSVMISHVSELAKALRQLVNPLQAQGESKSSNIALNSSVDSANPKVLAQSEATIKAVLDRIEKENGQHIIPGLNQDMASQLDSSARTSLAPSLALHSLFSNPLTLATKGTKEAVKTNDAQKNDALMATLPELTQALNAVQAFTRNMMVEMEKAMESGVSQNDGSLLSVHRSSGSSVATTYWAVSAISLLCDEMISICRSITLIDQNRLRAASKKASAVPTKEESAQSAQQISWDSHSEQNNSATHAITALRLTLSHTGIALMRIAMALHHAVKDNMNTVQHNIAMHTLQQCLLNSSAYASQYLAEGLLLSTGGASALPVMLNGSANWSHKQLHTVDAHLHPVQTHDCEKSSQANSCSVSSQPIGFSTDIVVGTVTNILKVFAQGGLIGLDTTLRLIKALEIISLHRDSHIALQLETQDSSNPNGAAKNILHAPSVGSSAGISAVLMNILEAFQTVDKSSGSQSTLNAQNRLKDILDEHIENLAFLKDDEEARENKKGLKEFYKIILRLLSPNGEPAAYDNLVKRLDFGGISLSNYHSLFGAYGDRPVAHSMFVATFANDDDAQGILRKFIDEAKENYGLLKSLHDELPNVQRSTKAQIMYDHVFEEVFQRYKQVKMSDVAQHGSTNRKIPTRDSFQVDIGLIQAPRAEAAEADVALGAINPGPR